MPDGTVGLKITCFYLCLTTFKWCIILSWNAWVLVFHWS